MSCPDGSSEPIYSDAVIVPGAESARDRETVRDSIEPRLLTNTLILGAGAAIGRASMILFRYMAVRRLAPDEYGAFALLSSFFVALLPLAHLNLGTSLVYLVSTRPSGSRALLRSTSLFTFLASLACGVLLGLWLPRAASDSLPGLVLFLTPLGFFAASMPTLIEGVFRGHLRIKQAAIVTAAAGVSRLFLFATLPLWLSSLNAVYSAFLFAPMLACLYGAFALRQSFSHSAGVTEPPSSISSALNYAVPVALTNILMGFMLYIPRSAVISAGLAEVGAVDLAMLSFSVFQMAVASSASALLPHFARQRTFSLRPILIAIATCVAVYELVVWSTNADLAALRTIGLASYSSAAFHFRIIAFACPALFHQTLRATELQALGRGKTALVLTAIGLLSQLLVVSPLRRELGVAGATLACAMSLFMISGLLEAAHRSLGPSRVP